mgnify:CR=1 FL=1
MLVSELRELLKKYKEEDLRLLVSEMYKAMPKKLREDKDIDALLQDVHTYMRIGKVESRQDKQVNVDDLKQKIDLFIDYAYKQYYFAPNSFVHKKERPKWRFIVKAYIKDLQDVSIDSEEGSVATDLFQKLYEMLSYACSYYIFNTENPFRSVGIEQTVLLDMVITRKLGSGINNESVKSAIELVINSELDRETLHSFLIQVLVMNLKSPDSKVIAIEQCKLLKKELQKPKPAPSKKSWSSDFSDYKRIDKINNLVETVFRLHIELCEYDEAIKYFNGNNIERSAEVLLYVLLSLLLEYELKELWLREYDEAVKKGVKPREALQKTYEYILENDKLPEYFLH